MTTTRFKDGEVFHHGMQTNVRSVAYDFRERRGRLDMEALCCCGMSGCIAFFKAIDRNVRRIETFSGGERDTTYVRSGNGWEAVVVEECAEKAEL